jgi:hypothetical protein
VKTAGLVALALASGMMLSAPSTIVDESPRASPLGPHPGPFDGWVGSTVPMKKAKAQGVGVPRSRSKAERMARRATRRARAVTRRRS